MRKITSLNKLTLINKKSIIGKISLKHYKRNTPILKAPTMNFLTKIKNANNNIKKTRIKFKKWKFNMLNKYQIYNSKFKKKQLKMMKRLSK